MWLVIWLLARFSLGLGVSYYMPKCTFLCFNLAWHCWASWINIFFIKLEIFLTVLKNFFLSQPLSSGTPINIYSSGYSVSQFSPPTHTHTPSLFSLFFDWLISRVLSPESGTLFSTSSNTILSQNRGVFIWDTGPGLCLHCRCHRRWHLGSICSVEGVAGLTPPDRHLRSKSLFKVPAEMSHCDLLWDRALWPHHGGWKCVHGAKALLGEVCTEQEWMGLNSLWQPTMASCLDRPTCYF